MRNVYIKQFLIILFSLTILVESAVNDPRFAHVSALLGNRLYIIGGQTLSKQMGSNDAFYLDLSNSFNVTNPPWIDITITSMPVTTSWANSAVLGNDGILLFNGFAQDMNSHTQILMNTLYLFNTSSQLWSIPTVNGTPPARRKELNIVSDDVNSKIYMYGGADEKDRWFMDMYVLNTFGLGFSWKSVQMSNGPFPMVDYTATMLPKGSIAYIGGRNRPMENSTTNQMEVNITQVNIYDTTEAKWYLMITDTGGKVIDNRSGHSAVLTSDGKIIIYGGIKGSSKISATPDLAVLDTNHVVYQWSVPQISSQLPSPLAFHTANMYQDYMIVAFGNITNGATSPLQINSGISILDTKAYVWLPSYNSTMVPSDNNSNKLGLILGLSCAGLVVIVASGIVGLFLYKRYRDRNSAIPTPGSDDATTTEVRNSIITNNSGNYDNGNSAVADDSSLIRPTYPTNYTHVSYTGIGGIGPDNPPYGLR